MEHGSRISMDKLWLCLSVGIEPATLCLLATCDPAVIRPRPERGTRPPPARLERGVLVESSYSATACRAKPSTCCVEGRVSSRRLVSKYKVPKT